MLSGLDIHKGCVRRLGLSFRIGYIGPTQSKVSIRTGYSRNVCFARDGHGGFVARCKSKPAQPGQQVLACHVWSAWGGQDYPCQSTPTGLYATYGNSSAQCTPSVQCTKVCIAQRSWTSAGRTQCSAVCFDQVEHPAGSRCFVRVLIAWLLPEPVLSCAVGRQSLESIQFQPDAWKVSYVISWHIGRECSGS